ncbi:RluA family pseudouridine synthase [Candidatus Gracilibacteria bacterium]|nr:RluA family pseudouridine synthase [Candidatus Gracilibacteria bacterium]
MYLSTLFSDFSRSYVQKLIDRGQVQVNGKTFSKNLKINNKDEILIEALVEQLEEIEPEDMNLDIIYEDDELVILNKEAGVNVHPVPGEGGNSNTLVNGVLHHCRNTLPTIGGVNRPGIVHRLDKDTSGAIMIAKQDKMMKKLQEDLKNRTNIKKYYLAVVHGVVKNKNFTIESFIGRDKNNRLKMTAMDPLNPKIAITHGEVIDYIENKYTLLKLKIDTGRTHQIRVQLASINHFILGDNTYGNSKINIEIKTRYQLKRQALHAYELDLELYGKQQLFTAPLKEDMKRIIPEELLKMI